MTCAAATTSGVSSWTLVVTQVYVVHAVVIAV
jgi:hypothetical protein